ncbi:GGDEF domain-containing protein [Roseibium sediminicola]|uniref:diguanylate cyclase n=1 Tax=Roseibium sediminicola TaxID=2933272 RepID=A0ABT0GTE7_9HYPH|nr:GGDEF domain-containing protein [Roseibium sp. CAU 1639]MCK7612073.1 GGDEF domain-containing protein [Roseibium sp. CAU 1639]
MQLDTPTLFTCLMIAEFAGSVILLLFYLFWPSKNADSKRSLAMWSLGMFLAAWGTVLIALRGTIPDALSIIAANFLIILGTGMRRSGFAVFLGLRGHVWLFSIVATAWLVLCMVPEFMGSFLMRTNFVQGTLIVSGLWVVAMAFWENRERLYSVKLLGIVTLIECAGFVWFTLNQNILLFPSFLAAFPEGFTVIFLVTLLFSMIMTIVLPASMVIERSLQRFREKASQDDLTGLANRCSFLDAAEDWLQENSQADTSYSLLLFEMEEFKTVNEKYSPAMGDALLQLFARILKDTLSEGAVSGRLSGTKFAVFLPETDKELTHLSAQRLCRRFALGCHEASGGKLVVTISVGAVSARVSTGLSRAMVTAEQALDKATKQGKAQIVTLDLAPNGTVKKSAGQSAFSLQRKNAA